MEEINWNEAFWNDGRRAVMSRVGLIRLHMPLNWASKVLTVTGRVTLMGHALCTRYVFSVTTRSHCKPLPKKEQSPPLTVFSVSPHILMKYPNQTRSHPRRGANSRSKNVRVMHRCSSRRCTLRCTLYLCICTMGNRACQLPVQGVQLPPGSCLCISSGENITH